jgi:hypothetical protein
VAGIDLGPAQLHRAQAGAMLGGQVLDHLAGQRYRCQEDGEGCLGESAGSSLSASSGSG